MEYQELARRHLDDGVVAMGLFGSHARGDFGRYSDIDIVRFWQAGSAAKEATTHLVGEHFVVVSNVLPGQAEEWFTSPAAATENIKGVTVARPLFDPDGRLATLIERARHFVWDERMQEKANRLVSGMMVGWIEEVQKSLAGLELGDPGRMLNGKHGLTWGMLTVMRIQRGVLLSGENGAFAEVLTAVGGASRWSALCRRAFGIDDQSSIREEVAAGLDLYVLTAEMLGEILIPEDKILVAEAAERISRFKAES